MVSQQQAHRIHTVSQQVTSNNYGGPTNGYTGPTNSYGGNSYNSSYNGTGYNATRPTLQPEDGKATAGIILSICSLA